MHVQISYVHHVSTQKVFLILELCQGGELSDLLKEKKAFKEDEAKVLMRMLIEAVVYMHGKGDASLSLPPSLPPSLHNN